MRKTKHFLHPVYTFIIYTRILHNVGKGKQNIRNEQISRPVGGIKM